MEHKDFTTTILVDETPLQAFNAINNVRGWWSEEVQGGTEKLNDEYNYHYRDVHTCKMKLIEVAAGERVVWLVLENYFKFTKDQSEWLNTKVIFDITKQGDKTKIHFTHQGLLPGHECFEICSNAWAGYIQNSLRSLIASGKGQPNAKEN